MDKIKLNKLLTNNHLFTNETIEELKKLTSEYPYFQIGWAVYLKALKEKNAANYNEVLKKVAVRVPNRKRLYKYLNSEIPQSQKLNFETNTIQNSYKLTNENNEIKSGDSLIDKFLSENNVTVRPEKNKIKYVTNEYLNQVVKNSVSENDEIVTETLANILLQQENYSKAQEAYRKLSLKYPEKSVYFASRIKEIEKLKT